MHKLLGNLLILKEYIKDPRRIGSIAQDSSTCVSKLLSHVDFTEIKTIIEWGGGSGAVTKEILNRLPLYGQLFTFEKNPMLFQWLKKTINDTRLIVINEDVIHTCKILEEHGITEVDAVVSTLPASNFSYYENLICNVLLPTLSEDGVFVQYLHTLSLLKRFRLEPLLSPYFNHIKKNFVLNNIPPCLIYSCLTISSP